jgi:hypothetical protein
VEVKENAITTEDLEAEVEYEQENGVDQAIVLAQLTGLLREVTLLNGEVERRREEAREIRDLFEERCRRLTRTVAELEDEVVELYGSRINPFQLVVSYLANIYLRQSDLVEDAVDLEGIQGTVHGLHDWIDRIREEQKVVRLSRDLAYQKARRSWISRRGKEGYTIETDGEMMLEGLSAWMRGWRDVEEGFQVRARARQIRRDRRQGQLLRLGEKVKLVCGVS